MTNHKLLGRTETGVPIYADKLCPQDDLYYIDLREAQYSGDPFPELDGYGYACIIPWRYSMLDPSAGVENLPVKLVEMLEEMIGQINR